MLSQVTKLLPHLRILDGIRFDPKFLLRKSRANKNADGETLSRLGEVQNGPEKRRHPGHTVEGAISNGAASRKPALKERKEDIDDNQSIEGTKRKRRRKRTSDEPQKPDMEYEHQLKRADANDKTQGFEHGPDLPLLTREKGSKSHSIQEAGKEKGSRSRRPKPSASLQDESSLLSTVTHGKFAKSIGGSLATSADQAPAKEGEEKLDRNLEDLTKMRSSVVSIITAPSLSQRKSLVSRTRIERVTGKNQDVLAHLTKQQAEANVVKGWD